MPKFTQQVLDFIHEFVIEDIQKVLSCSAADAKEALHRIVTQPVNQRPNKSGKTDRQEARQFHKVKSLVAETKTAAPKPQTRLKGQYSNQNSWDKYDL